MKQDRKETLDAIFRDRLTGASRLPARHPFSSPTQTCGTCAERATHFIRVFHPIRPGSLGFSFVGCLECTDAWAADNKARLDAMYPRDHGCVVEIHPLIERPGLLEPR